MTTPKRNRTRKPLASPGQFVLSELAKPLALEKLRAARTDAALAAQLVAANPALTPEGNMTTLAQRAWLERVTTNELARATIGSNLAAIEEALRGPAPSQVERMAAGRVALCWLEANYLDALAGQARDGTVGLKQRESAHRRYLAALESMARIQRMVAGRVGA